MISLKSRIKKLRNKNKTFREISKIIGCSISHVYAIYHGRRSGEHAKIYKYKDTDLNHNCFSLQNKESDFGQVILRQTDVLIIAIIEYLLLHSV